MIPRFQKEVLSKPTSTTNITDFTAVVKFEKLLQQFLAATISSWVVVNEKLQSSLYSVYAVFTDVYGEYERVIRS